MSGECEKCGEHAVDCKDDVYEDKEKKYVSPVTLRDKCDKLSGLLHCLEIVVNDEKFKSYIFKSHDYLFQTIEEGLKEIEEALKKL